MTRSPVPKSQAKRAVTGDEFSPKKVQNALVRSSEVFPSNNDATQAVLDQVVVDFDVTCIDGNGSGTVVNWISTANIWPATQHRAAYQSILDFLGRELVTRDCSLRL